MNTLIVSVQNTILHLKYKTHDLCYRNQKNRNKLTLLLIENK